MFAVPVPVLDFVYRSRCITWYSRDLFSLVVKAAVDKGKAAKKGRKYKLFLFVP
jgi:hypothetical protein